MAIGSLGSFQNLLNTLQQRVAPMEPAWTATVPLAGASAGVVGLAVGSFRWLGGSCCMSR